MQIHKKSFGEVRQFSSRDVAYTTEDPALGKFYKYSTDLKGFEEAMADRKFFKVDRQLLVDVLKEQYATRANNALALTQIDKLSVENAFTVVTAHQPSLFTGPLYFIYKIACTINLSRKLSDSFEGKHVIPVFVSGGEDHDFEEINHVKIFQKKVEWNQPIGGAVGRLDTESLQPVIDELADILGGSENATKAIELIRKSYAPGKKYGAATLDFVHELFGAHGLVVLSMDDARMKKGFAPIILREIIEQPSEALVSATQEELRSSGFKEQAHARLINFFYLSPGSRERIEQDETGSFKVINTDLSFTQAEMEAEIAAHPDRFSPNVVMRPLYQESILPNLAYVGGGGELAYWLERKEQFAHFNVFFPMLLRRSSVLFLDKGSLKKMKKLGLSVDDIFRDKDDLIRGLVNSESQVDLSYDEESRDIETALDGIVKKAAIIDPTLAKSLAAEKTRLMKSVNQMGGRLLRTEKQKQEQQINQLESLLEKLFPSDSLQERKDNFLSLYLSQGDQLIAELVDKLNPLEKEMVILAEE